MISSRYTDKYLLYQVYMGLIIGTISRVPPFSLWSRLATASVKTSAPAVPSLPWGAVLPMAFASEGHQLNHAWRPVERRFQTSTAMWWGLGRVFNGWKKISDESSHYWEIGGRCGHRICCFFRTLIQRECLVKMTPLLLWCDLSWFINQGQISHLDCPEGYEIKPLLNHLVEIP